MIYFVCPRPASPSGGVWFIHQLVALLNELEQPARVIRTEPFDVWWDAHPTPPEQALAVDPQDASGVYVIPDCLWGTYETPGRRLCFTQNYAWQTGEVAGQPTLVCSEFLTRYMRGLKADVIGEIQPFLHAGLWRPNAKQADSVLLMARRSEHAALVADKLISIGMHVELIESPLTQRELAAFLGPSEYYVHLATPEGFPLACLEAMACNCVVVGLTGGGGDEFMHGAAEVIQETRNGEQLARRVLGAMRQLRSDSFKKASYLASGQERARRYTRQRTLDRLRAIPWDS